ncbi:hypothetical protein FJT64_006815 [Amphibalanus amphitrite]|uniref:Uncharacterized protein n=1 Tax=Amphibalanus amphitrite TaxID=1232801 RepID=A0A6A4VS04_AMPAM|nr:hypothetical protein FJT64_006815 [Amphibalanus amphitrite]
MRPAIGSALLLMCALLAARPAAGLSTDPPAASSAAEGVPRPAEDQGGKVKRNVRTTEEMRILCSDTGYVLELLPNGEINVTNDEGNSPYVDIATSIVEEGSTPRH